MFYGLIKTSFKCQSRSSFFMLVKCQVNNSTNLDTNLVVVGGGGGGGGERERERERGGGGVRQMLPLTRSMFLEPMYNTCLISYFAHP
jgi:hypothetical protein